MWTEKFAELSPISSHLLNLFPSPLTGVYPWEEKSWYSTIIIKVAVIFLSLEIEIYSLLAELEKAHRNSGDPHRRSTSSK